MTRWLGFMTRTDGHRAVYLWRAYLLALIGTLLVAVLAVLVFPQPETDPAPPPPLFGFVVLWPAVSTLVLWGLLEAARRRTPTYWHAAGAATLACAGFFSLAAGLQSGLIFAWAYFIYALTFLAWQLRSTAEGIGMTFALQASVHLTLFLFVFPQQG